MLDRIEKAIVAENATAIRMRVSEMVGAGHSLATAKVEALRRYAMAGVPAHLRQQVVDLVNGMEPGDIHPVDTRDASDRHYRSYVAAGIIRDSWVNRTLFRLFGATL